MPEPLSTTRACTSSSAMVLELEGDLRAIGGGSAGSGSLSGRGFSRDPAAVRNPWGVPASGGPSRALRQLCHSSAAGSCWLQSSKTVTEGKRAEHRGYRDGEIACDS
eukprot:scaffold2038_cov259-Pinguiococcus_pyrenoidosus.AAC.10